MVGKYEDYTPHCLRLEEGVKELYRALGGSWLMGPGLPANFTVDLGAKPGNQSKKDQDVRCQNKHLDISLRQI